MKFDGLYEFTTVGMEAFQQAFTCQLEEEAIDPVNPAIAKRIAGTSNFEISEWKTSIEMANAVLAAAGSANVRSLLNQVGLWGWLSFVCRDVVYPRKKDGKRKLGEVWRWYPSDPGDYQKAQRHLIRMPVLLQSAFGEDAEHLLLGSPSTLGELREQLTSQQDMFHPSFQRAARLLYLDKTSGKLRRGAAGKRGGASRRLRQVRRQLDVTWDLFALAPEQIIDKLPKEFDQFKPKAANTTPA